jgi:uncharacterized repeat protein (TIGR04052 family)
MRSNTHKKNRYQVIVAGIAFALLTLLTLPLTAGAVPAQSSGKSKVQSVSIGFTAMNGTEKVSCSKPLANLGTTSRSAKLTDLRFYVSGVQLLRKGGGVANVKLTKGSKWSYTKGKDGVTLIDLENGTGACAAEGTSGMNMRVRGTVPKGKYVGVRYSVSVPESINHTDLTVMPAPLNNLAMAWNWQFGRKFVKIEVSEDTGTPWASKTMFLHVGSTGCTGNPAAGEDANCSLPNRNSVTFRKFNPAKQQIAINLKPLLGGIDVSDGFCMSDPTDADCGPLFSALGMKVGTKERTTQTAFRVVRK